MTEVYDGTRDILEDRKRRRLALAAEMRALGKFKKRLKHRLKERDWPIDAVTGEKAEIDHEDVMAPLPDDLKVPIGNVDEKMVRLRAEAERHEAFTEAVDVTLMLRRQREREEERQRAASVTGPAWTADIVEARLIEAYETLFRSSISGAGPRAFGNAMPVPIRQMSDMVAQAGNKSLRNAIAHRFKGTPSVEEVRRAEESLAWALTYLSSEHPDLAGFLNLGAMWKAWGAKVSKKCSNLGVHRQVFYRDRKEAIQIIVEGLTRDGKAPT